MGKAWVHKIAWENCNVQSIERKDFWKLSTFGLGTRKWYLPNWMIDISSLVGGIDLLHGQLHEEAHNIIKKMYKRSSRCRLYIVELLIQKINPKHLSVFIN